MSASQDIFRAYDIRGVYGEELDAEIGKRVGLAFGNYLRRNHSEGKVSIGCDARVSSPELQEAVSVGILNECKDDLGVITAGVVRAAALDDSVFANIN